MDAFTTVTLVLIIPMEQVMRKFSWGLFIGPNVFTPGFSAVAKPNFGTVIMVAQP